MKHTQDIENLLDLLTDLIKEKEPNVQTHLIEFEIAETINRFKQNHKLAD